MKLSTKDIEFPKEALEQAKSAVRIKTASYLAKRADLRGKAAFTFAADENAPCGRAFTLYRNGSAWRLGVHIADVGEIVCIDSPLDAEAKYRCSSYETPSGRLEMLPPLIVEEVCNLKEDADRLAVSIILDIERDGRLVSVNFDESIIRVAKRCIYRETDELFSRSDPSAMMVLREKYAQLLPMLNDMYELAGVLNARRIASGGLDYTTFRRTFTRGSDGSIENSGIESKFDTELLIDELLYFSSASIGKYMRDNHMPCLFLGQEAPDDATIEWMSRVVGIDIPKSLPAAKRAALAAEASKGTPYHTYVNEAMSVLLPCPTYSALPVFNARCASDTVVSFSSPVEKYADLLTQQVIKEAIAASGRTGNINLNRYFRETRERSERASEAEKTAYGYNLAINGICSLEFLRAKGSQPLEGIPVSACSNGDVMVMLKDGIFARIPAGEHLADADSEGFSWDGRRIAMFEKCFFRCLIPSRGRGESIVSLVSAECFT